MAESDLLNMNVTIFAEQPQSDIHSFIGNWTNHDTGFFMELELQHTLWSGCVLESAHATGMVIYTGIDIELWIFKKRFFFVKIISFV